MNLIGENFPVRPRLDKNLFSLKYGTGSCFLKSMRNLVRLTWEISVLTRGFLLYPGNLRTYFYLFFRTVSCLDFLRTWALFASVHM